MACWGLPLEMHLACAFEAMPWVCLRLGRGMGVNKNLKTWELPEEAVRWIGDPSSSFLIKTWQRQTHILPLTFNLTLPRDTIINQVFFSKTFSLFFYTLILSKISQLTPLRKLWVCTSLCLSCSWLQTDPSCKSGHTLIPSITPQQKRFVPQFYMCYSALVG